MNFFHKESKSKKIKSFGTCVCVAGAGGGGVEVSRGMGRWMDRRADEQAQTNLPLQLLRSWGHNNALMCKLCP